MKFWLSGALCAAVCLLAASATNAGQIVDQSNLVATGIGYLGNSGIRSNFSQAQTVTAGQDGLLSRIDLQLFRVGDPVTFELSLYDGDFAGAYDFPVDNGPPGSPGGFGTLVGTISISSASLPTREDTDLGALASFDVSNFGYYVHPGQVFSLLAQSLSPRAGVAWVLGYYLDIDDGDSLVGADYANGYNAAQFYDSTFVRTRVDRSFRTWVDVAAVPEPGSWVLMIAGFGLLGSNWRRRRRQFAV